MASIIKEQSDLQRKVKIYNWIFSILIIGIFSVVYIFYGDFTSITSFLFINTLLIFILYRKTRIIYRGFKGENAVFKKLKKLSQNYYVFNDVNLIIGEKKAQIDHVLVHNSGVWCVETKSHIGWIFGREKDKNWTQTKFSSNGKLYKNKFYNPILQNKVHCSRIKEFLEEKGLKKTIIHSIVVFTSAQKMKLNTDTPVLDSNHFLEYIKDFEEEYNYSDLEKNEIVRALAENEQIELEEYFD